jgi:predicted TIM-barrel enzyme
MNRFEEVFGTSPVLLPVVHPVGRQEALEAVRVARDLGVRGVFLIDQMMHERDVLALVREIRHRHPALWIGINLLTQAPAEALGSALDACGSIDGIWSDDAGINERGMSHPRAEAFVAERRVAGWSGLYFGGVAFKYQREVVPADLCRAASAAVTYMDVVCTSGPGTGLAADVEKVRELRSGLGDHAMALASGVTPENVCSYLPYAQVFLVGTGIEASLGVLDPVKIERLMRAMERR